MANWWSSIEKGMNAGRLANAEADASAAESRARLARSQADTAVLVVREVAAQRDAAYEEIRQLKEQLRQQQIALNASRREVNTLAEESDFLQVMVGGLGKALVQSTGDVAQLTGIDPSFVAGRYKLAVIDMLRDGIENGDFDSRGPSNWKEGLSPSDKIRCRIEQMQAYDHLCATDELSMSDACDEVKKRFGVELKSITYSYYWLDWNPGLLAEIEPTDAINAYKAADDIMIRAINLKSGALKPGELLQSDSSEFTQRADSIHGIKQEGGKSKPIGLHPWVQNNHYRNWTADSRTSGNGPIFYGQMANKLALHLNQRAGFDITKPDAVKPWPPGYKNTTQQ